MGLGIDHLFDNFGYTVGVPGDQIKMVFCLLISYPFGFIFKRIHNATVRHVLGTALGFAFQFLIYKADILYPLVLALIVYFVMKYLGRNKAVLIFIISMGFLSIFHIYRMWVDWGGYKMDVTSVLMINVCKQTTLAWCYQDGGKDKEKLSASQNKYKVTKLPTLLEYLSFMYFYANTLVGPACEYLDHDNFINRRDTYKETPRTFFASLGYLVSGLCFMGVIVFFAPKYNANGIIDPSYAASGWAYKFFYLFTAMLIQRCRYYSAWMISTANVTGPGLNYDPTGKTFFEKYGKIVAVRPLTVELKDNVKDRIEGWNSASQVWLKNYVYFRICSEAEAKTNPKKNVFASNCVFMISAFWHGFYLGYYFAFFWMFLAQQIAKTLFQIRAKLRWIPEPIGYPIRWFLSGFYINLFGTTFVLLELNKAFILYKAWLWLPNIALVIVYGFFTLTGVGKKPRAKKAVDETQPTPAPETKKTN